MIIKLRTLRTPCLIALCFVAVILFLSNCNEGSIPLKILSKEDIIKEYTRNSERFLRVAEYMKSEDANIFIEKTEKGSYVAKKPEGNNIASFEITDESIDNDIRYILNKLKYKYISEDGDNGIYFTRQTSLRLAHGIAYSKDGQKPDWGTIEELVNIEGNWYYYKGY